MHFINLNLQDEWLIITPEDLRHTCKLLQIWKKLIDKKQPSCFANAQIADKPSGIS